MLAGHTKCYILFETDEGFQDGWEGQLLNAVAHTLHVFHFIARFVSREQADPNGIARHFQQRQRRRHQRWDVLERVADVGPAKQWPYLQQVGNDGGGRGSGEEHGRLRVSPEAGTQREDEKACCVQRGSEQSLQKQFAAE